ncbi:MAG: WYL domain-containing protein [Actinomycetes bacterium]
MINIAYSDRHDVTTARQVQPVGFYGHTDGWYRIGWCRLRDDGRIFRIERIRHAALTKETAPERDTGVVLGWDPESTITPTTRTRSN